MGLSTTQSSKSSFIEGEKYYLSHRGKDTDGITESFQHHDQFLCKHEVKLTYSDKFFREAFRPMHLMDFKLFNNIIDKFIGWAEKERGKAKQDCNECTEELDGELIPYSLFVQFFTEDQNHLIQVFDKASPMRSVFRFGQMLTRTVSHQEKQQQDVSSDSEISAIVDQVLRESMLNPATMNFMSDDMQNQFLRESIMATMQIEINKDPESKKEEQKQQQEVYVDIFCLRVLSLLVCRGKPTEKARFLAELVANQTKGKQAASVAWNNPRLRAAVRFILYFSSILPLKFLSVHQDQDVFNRILSLGKYSQRRKGTRISIPTYDFDSSYLWSDQKIKQTEKMFDDVFELFYEEKFLQVIFANDQNSISAQSFAKKFFAGKIGSSEEETPSTADWLFSPCRVAGVFNHLLKGVQREECFLIEKIDWQDEQNDILSLDSFETNASSVDWGCQPYKREMIS